MKSRDCLGFGVREFFVWIVVGFFTLLVGCTSGEGGTAPPQDVAADTQSIDKQKSESDEGRSGDEGDDDEDGDSSNSGSSILTATARWNSSERRLTVSGTAARNAQVVVVDAGTGVQLAQARANDDRRWTASVRRPAVVPCQVRVRSGGREVVAAVERAPANCSQQTSSNSAPNGRISSPTADAVIQVGASVSFAGDGSDPDNNIPLTFRWDFAGAAPASIQQNPGLIRFDRAGTYSVTLAVTDSLGLTDSTPAVRVITVRDVTTNNVAPVGTITSPASDVVIAPGGTVSFSSNASDADNNVPFSFAWTFEGLGISSNAQVPGNVTFANAGTYRVTLTVRDSLGLADATPDARVITVQSVVPPPLNTSHAGRFTTYEGSKTCLQCHAQQVHEAHSAQHYQMFGPTPKVVNMTSGGKIGGINDFCGYPDINWLGQLTNLDGNKVDGGCATCHVGMGAKPSATATTAQLENIDCLTCHSDTYRRKVVAQADGSFKFAPAPEKMAVPLERAITDIHRTPTRGSCVNCHSYAGGGCNNKRGDLEEAHREPPTASFDVHMASTNLAGAGLVCVDCHQSASHKIAGRGVDLRQTDLDVAVRCTNCHLAQPHNNTRLDKHAGRLDCTVCHIPVFAKIVATDMVRDFSKPAVVDQATRLYEPNIVRQANVVPEYRFWNGLSSIYSFGAAATPGANGRILMAGPQGSITDASAKIFPFKRHLAEQPIDPVSKRLLPMKTSVLFQTGNIDQAIRQGAAEVGWALPNGYQFASTERLMGIFHEVSPAQSALACTNCHGATRMNFAALGYTPKTTRNNRPLCASCHSDESGAWSAAELFTQVHARHVDREQIRCSECHNF